MKNNDCKNDKPAFVLLRGLCRGNVHWAGFDRALQLAFPDSKVIAIELPGNGFLSYETSPISIADMVEYYRQEIKKFGLTLGGDRVHLIAVSMGGMVALEWSLAYPKEIGSTWIINSSISGLSPFWQRIRIGSLFALLWASIFGTKHLERAILRLTTLTPEQQQGVWMTWSTFANNHPLKFSNFIRQIVAASKYSWRAVERKLGDMEIDNLYFMVGEQDRLVSPTCTYRLAAALDAPICIHSAAGHDLTLDDPAWVIQQIQSKLCG